MAAKGPAAKRHRPSTTRKVSRKAPEAAGVTAEQSLLATVHDLVLELHPHRRRGLRVRLDSGRDVAVPVEELDGSHLAPLGFATAARSWFTPVAAS